MKVALTLAAGMLAASSMAFAADNNGGKNNGKDSALDNSKTNSINSEGRTISPEEREFCVANPGDSKCQGLGGEMNQQ